MRRLNVHDRKKMVQWALERAFNSKEAELALREDQIVRELYSIAFKPEVFKAVEVLGSNWLSYQKTHRFNVGGFAFDLRSKELMAYPRGRSFPIATVNDAVFWKKITDLMDEKKALAAAKKQTEAQLEALVGSVTTLKRLQEVWPEGKAIWGRLDPEPAKIFLPAVKIEDLNATLRLP